MPAFEERFSQSGAHQKGRFKRAWRESHGNALMAFAGLIFVIGLIIIWTSPPEPEEPEIDLAAAAAAPAIPELPEDVLVIRVATSQPTSQGPVRIAIYDSKESFGDPEKAVIKDSLTPIQGFATWEIKLEILPESFAIAAYHDLDDNGELNRALFNAPVEPYGFSNNARSLIGPPTFQETIMERPDESTAIEVRVY